MARSSSADVLWLTAHYLVGLRRLGYDPYYVETRTGPTAHDEPARAAALIDGVLRRFDLGDRWAYHVLASKGGLAIRPDLDGLQTRYARDLRA